MITTGEICHSSRRRIVLTTTEARERLVLCPCCSRELGVRVGRGPNGPEATIPAHKAPGTGDRSTPQKRRVSQTPGTGTSAVSRTSFAVEKEEPKSDRSTREPDVQNLNAPFTDAWSVFTWAIPGGA